jgi:hypothetical protein
MDGGTQPGMVRESSNGDEEASVGEKGRRNFGSSIPNGILVS